MQEINKFYEVFEALITERKVINTSTYSDSSLNNALIELEYRDFGTTSVNLISDNGGISYQMNFQNRFVTTDIRIALKVAIKGYKELALKRKTVQSLEQYFHKYYKDYPELFI